MTSPQCAGTRQDVNHELHIEETWERLADACLTHDNECDIISHFSEITQESTA